MSVKTRKANRNAPHTLMIRVISIFLALLIVGGTIAALINL